VPVDQEQLNLDYGGAGGGLT